MCYSGNRSSCQRERAAQRDTERTERDARLRETYRAEGWGKLAEIAGFDPVNTESSARMAFRFGHEIIAAKDALIERLKLEAQAHAGEARTANATIGEIYQAISGATGEPGNWNGAEPVRAYVAAKDATIARLRGALENARDKFEAIRYDGEYHASHETMVACRDAVDGIDAALAKVRGK